MRVLSELKIVFVGHVDHGKSTIIGRLLHDTHSLPRGVIDRVQKIADDTGKEFEYAYLLDAFAEERSQGITIDMTQIRFETEERNYLIIDAPGHKEFLKNMISGSANANVAFLVIDAAAGVREQSKRHAYLLSLLGIKKIYVLVNKMDLVDYAEDRFNRVVDDMKKFLDSIDVKPKNYIPISGFRGDNVTRRSENLSWFDGGTLLETLDAIDDEDDPDRKPLRLPIQDVYKFDERRIIAGRIEAGTISVGDRIKIFPDGRETTVVELAAWLERDKKNSASAGESVGLIVKDEFFNRRGELISLADQSEPKVSNRLRASVFWLGKTPLTIGKKYKLKSATSEVEAEVERIIRTIDAVTLQNTQAVEVMNRNDVAELVIKLKREIAFDEFIDCQATGRFVIVDGYDVSGGGIILSEESSAAVGATFVGNNANLRAELFDEFYYDVEKRQITHVAGSQRNRFEIGDEIQTRGLSFDYPDDFDVISLSDAAVIKIRGKKITEIVRLDDYRYDKMPLVNGRGFGIKVNTEEQFNLFLKEFRAVSGARQLAAFSNKYFFLNQYRELKFYFDYVI